MLTLEPLYKLGQRQMVHVALELIAEPTKPAVCPFCKKPQPHWCQDRRGVAFAICTVCGQGSTVKEDA